MIARRNVARIIARRNVLVGLCFTATLAGLGLVERRLEREISAQATVMATYEVANGGSSARSPRRRP